MGLSGFLLRRGTRKMSFQVLYEDFLQNQLKSSEGERKRKLKEGLGYSEKLFLEQVWYPAIGNFKHLHAEYEISDYKDGSRFLDFAYLEMPHRICIEIDGYGPHYRDINRYGVIDRSFRQNDLIMDRWFVFRFPTDAIKEQPRRCQQYVQQMMGRLYPRYTETLQLSIREWEVLRYAMHLERMNEHISISSVSSGLQISRKHTWTLLTRLQQKKLLIPAKGKIRVTAYIVNPEVTGYLQEYHR
jgi:hypothetical protein